MGGNPLDVRRWPCLWEREGEEKRVSEVEIRTSACERPTHVQQIERSLLILLLLPLLFSWDLLERSNNSWVQVEGMPKVSQPCELSFIFMISGHLARSLSWVNLTLGRGFRNSHNLNCTCITSRPRHTRKCLPSSLLWLAFFWDSYNCCPVS